MRPLNAKQREALRLIETSTEAYMVRRREGTWVERGFIAGKGAWSQAFIDADTANVLRRRGLVEIDPHEPWEITLTEDPQR